MKYIEYNETFDLVIKEHISKHRLLKDTRKDRKETDN